LKWTNNVVINGKKIVDLPHLNGHSSPKPGRDASANGLLSPTLLSPDGRSPSPNGSVTSGAKTESSLGMWVQNVRGDDSLVGQRPDTWWTGLAPPACPGFNKATNALNGLAQIKTTGVTRQDVLDYFDNGWTMTELVFSCLVGEEAFYRPPYHHLRHPLVFYYNHPAVVYVNKLRVAGLLKEAIDPHMEHICEVGVDEMSWDDMDKNDMLWPSIAESTVYRRKVYEALKNIIMTHPDLENLSATPVTTKHPLWALFMGFEHERIHLETTSVLMRELPLERVQQAKWMPPLGTDCSDHDAPVNELISIPGGQVVVGKSVDFPSYGWDNEYGTSTIDLTPFKASKFKCTNAEYLEFVKDAGYTTKKFWTEDGWKWRSFRNVKWPTFWQNYGPAGLHQYRIRTLFAMVDFQPSWPVIVNFHEAQAFCKWKSAKSGMTVTVENEAQHNAIRDFTSGQATERWIKRGSTIEGATEVDPILGNPNANLGFKYSSETPVDKYTANAKGFYDTFGSVWEWCTDYADGLDGFQTHPYYEDFSVPCFDGRHNLIMGGSFISTGDEASVFARFHFRSHFFQHAGFRYVFVQPKTLGEVPESNPYEGQTMLNEYLTFHFAKPEDLFPHADEELAFARTQTDFPRRVAEVVMKYADPKKRSSVVDIGCAVGRSVFELAREFDKAVGIDFSASFVDACNHIKMSGETEFRMKESGQIFKTLKANIDPKIDRTRTSFRVGDACALPKDLGSFDAVLMANLICRTPDPRSVLAQLPALVNSGGLLVMTTPFTWMEEYTPKEKWLGAKNDQDEASIDVLKKILMDTGFELVHQGHLPMVMLICWRANISR
jgi:5-histidylcysteine sulfoxide synthase/putative 4-mercaptohistidine N1-methyltranferase